jgi:hypothetical protein
MNLNSPRYRRRYNEDEDSEYITPSTFKHPTIIQDRPVKQISLNDPEKKNKFMRHILPTFTALGLGSMAFDVLNFQRTHRTSDHQGSKLTLEPASSMFIDNKEHWNDF